ARTVHEMPSRAQCREPVHHAIDDRLLALVLQAEVSVNARNDTQRAHLAFDPLPARHIFDGAAQAPIELGDADDFFGRGRAHEPRITPSAASHTTFRYAWAVTSAAR